MLKTLLMGAALLMAVTSANSVLAQDYPTKKPIKIIVGFNPGGGTDVMARITAEFLQARLGQAVVVENRPGASSAIAAELITRAEPDGYTLFATTAELAVLPAVRPDLPFTHSDFTYLVRPFASTPLVAVGPNSPHNSLEDLIAAMRANPGKMRWGTPGVGGINHLGTISMELATNTEGVHIPYTGAGAVYTDLLAGVIDFYNGASLPVPEGIKILGPAGSRRHPNYPEIASFEELGYKGVNHESWWGFVAPPGMDPALAERITNELLAIYADPVAIEKFQSSIKLLPDDPLLAGDDFAAKIEADYQIWKDLVARENIVVQQ